MHRLRAAEVPTVPNSRGEAQDKKNDLFSMKNHPLKKQNYIIEMRPSGITKTVPGIHCPAYRQYLLITDQSLFSVGVLPCVRFSCW